tara:strand:+ start:345 stop:668 length:324 start_codon:yes stop_codon:yes gene_type:complete
MKIIILVLLIMNLILISFGLSELNNIKNELEPLKLFLRLYGEQNNDLKKKIEDIKKDKELNALSNQEIRNNLVNQFQLNKTKKIMDERNKDLEKNSIENFINDLDFD